MHCLKDFVCLNRKQFKCVNDLLKRAVLAWVLSGIVFANADVSKKNNTKAEANRVRQPVNIPPGAWPTRTSFPRYFIPLPPDQTINACGTSVVLTSESIPGYSNPTWSDGSTGTTFTATSSGTYWWQVTGTNIVTNGDFSSGNTGFTSSYSMPSSCSGCCCGIRRSRPTRAS